MSNWDINSLKKERSKITKRTQIGLNNLKQRKRLITLHNKGLASKKKGLRPRIMSNREIVNHKKYIKKTFKDIYRNKIEKIDHKTEKRKVHLANKITNREIRQ